MLSVLGLGHALPQGRLTTEFLGASLGLERPAYVSPGRTVASVLSESYLSETRNREVERALEGGVATPTDLAEQAVMLAMKRAGVSSEELDLILAGGSTPQQTTPSEAQRVGKRLGTKIPAYDLFSSSGDIPLHIHTLRRWKEDRVPSRVLSVSTSCPTQRVFYDSTPYPFLFGDGAAALVLAPNDTGRLAVTDAAYRTEPSQAELFVIELYGHLRFEEEALREWYRKTLTALLSQALERNGLEASSVVGIGPQLFLDIEHEVFESAGLSSDRIWSNGDAVGCSLGSSPYVVLSERWDDISAGQNLVVLSAGMGLSAGYVVLKG